MGKKVHIICEKCGSDDMEFTYINNDDIFPDAYLKCNCCGELTSIDEWNEFNKKGRYNDSSSV